MKAFLSNAMQACCLALLAGAAWFISSCAGDGSGLGTGVPLAPTYDSIQINIFNVYCIECHRPGGSAPFSLLPGDAYNNTVNVLSAQDETANPGNGRDRIEPGDPDTSYLYLKVIGDASIDGQRMPLNGPPYLSQTEIDVIAEWITDGAQP